MTGNNPFSDNPWQANTAPVNAYEDNPQSSWAPAQPASALPPPIPPRMPSPSAYHPPATNWQESNKTESAYDSSWNGTTTTTTATTTTHAPIVQDAYQYSGTAYGNQDFSTGNAYNQAPSPQPAAATTATPRPTSSAEAKAALPPRIGTDRNPSKRRLLLRFLQFIAAIGSVGFAAGASPFAGVAVPLSNAACLYFLYAVAIVSILWSGFHLIFFLLRRVSSRQKMNRPMMTGIDLLLTIMWGIGVIVEVVKYRCSPGGYNHWCDFYNVSIFWGFFSFALFIVATGWDFVGACILRKKQ
ncbi:hypothetical protein CLU79DRAFT_763667 [Phycomyces nitens]|nr:hypothetical protein CLU79DRAFT_763667 [Phycomyces nitens]